MGRFLPGDKAPVQVTAVAVEGIYYRIGGAKHRYNVAMTAGIYQIVCWPNGRRYYGQSKNIGARWNEHRCSLRKNTHINKDLQNDFNLHGGAQLIFSVLQVIDESAERKKAERALIDGDPPCYNKIGKKGWSGHNKGNNHRKGKVSPLKGRTIPAITKAKTGYKLPIVTCPHCQKKGANSLMSRWHFDNCKYKP